MLSVTSPLSRFPTSCTWKRLGKEKECSFCFWWCLSRRRWRENSKGLGCESSTGRLRHEKESGETKKRRVRGRTSPPATTHSCAHTPTHAHRLQSRGGGLRWLVFLCCFLQMLESQQYYIPSVIFFFFFPFFTFFFHMSRIGGGTGPLLRGGGTSRRGVYAPLPGPAP